MREFPARVDAERIDPIDRVAGDDGNASLATGPMPDDGYHYRVDSASELRRLSEASAFLPTRWDSAERPWPHKMLC